ncbi:unnamed protein product [Paramecium pentaurelia]|uniref:Transmembrane protein 107 n=1 Tax=Paramecium pentaurelia TaxID=43138 RepID=A0A8S1WS88_9CILI|nr:unnamed protein product [Paramecium pentaurelia]
MKILSLNKFSETSRSLIVSKFILVILELIITCQCLGATHQNISAGIRAIPTADEYEEAQVYIIIFLILCILFQAAQIGLNMLAMNIHFDKVNSILCIYHFVGVWTFVCFLFDRWKHKTIMYIWVIFCIIPFLFEFLTSLNGYYYYGIHEHRQMEAKRQALLAEQQKKKKQEEEEAKKLEDENQPLNPQDGIQNAMSQ